MLHEKLVANPASAYFDHDDRRHLLVDRVSWIRRMFETSIAQFSAHEPIRRAISGFRLQIDLGLDGVPAAEVRNRMRMILAELERLSKKTELSGPVYEDLIQLKSIYSRYQNYLNWLEKA